MTRFEREHNEVRESTKLRGELVIGELDRVASGARSAHGTKVA